MLPKLPTLPPGASPIFPIRSKGEIQAEHDKRIAAARKSAHVVTPAEQVQREERAKVEARKSSAETKKAVIAGVAPDVPKAPTVVRATMFTLTGLERPMSADTGSKLLAASVSVLRDDSSTTRVILAEGVCLALWVGDRCVQRKFYATAKNAHDAGKAALAEDRCVKFTVSDTVRRGDVLAGDKAPARDQVIPSRKRQKCAGTGKTYGENHHWGTRVKESRATFSHG